MLQCKYLLKCNLCELIGFGNGPVLRESNLFVRLVADDPTCSWRGMEFSGHGCELAKTSTSIPGEQFTRGKNTAQNKPRQN